MWRLRVLLFKLKLCILCTGNHTHTHTYTQCSLLSNTVTVYILNSQQSPVCFKPQTNNTLLHTVVIDTDDIWTVLWLSAPHPLTLLPSYPHSLVIRPCVFLSSSFPFHSLLSLVLVVCLIFFLLSLPGCSHYKFIACCHGWLKWWAYSSELPAWWRVL